jgi:hypothetical protein
MQWIEDILLTEELVKPNALEEFSGSQTPDNYGTSQGLRDAMELEGEREARAGRSAAVGLE